MLLVALIVVAVVLAVAPADAPTRAPARARLAHPLPPRGPLAQKATELHGPRIVVLRTHGRDLTFWGAAGIGRRVLVAGCVARERCAGEGVVTALQYGCPPADADLWIFPSLRGGGAGAATWRQAVADLRPDVAIVFRAGTVAGVTAAGPSAIEGRRYAHLAGLPFAARADEGLASWAQAVRPGTHGITVTLPARVGPDTASRLAYAIDRVAGTRFAAGALEERRRLIATGKDPRVPRY